MGDWTNNVNQLAKHSMVTLGHDWSHDLAYLGLGRPNGNGRVWRRGGRHVRMTVTGGGHRITGGRAIEGLGAAAISDPSKKRCLSDARWTSK
jgi:hypothetical protein